MTIAVFIVKVDTDFASFQTKRKLHEKEQGERILYRLRRFKKV